ncbi:MAG: 3-methyl-2-oxobutanoate hydroxymethyltransferase [Porticoccaceae bacterium]|nr:3-methyl-2-oxobutanoate hydroxymethyltransferase [Porticoccaceae bacterium]
MTNISIDDLKSIKASGQKFAAITAYDYSFAKLIDKAEIEVTLVGDSLGNVIQGQQTTIPVTLDEMAYHTTNVKRGIRSSLILSDMPFMSYATVPQALDNAAVLMQAGAQMVKLEGGEWLTETVYALTERGIPVCGHLGLTPQSVHKLSGFKVQGKDANAADKILAEAKMLEEAGADLLVIECVPSALGSNLASTLDIPVIGIGAGSDTDGQVLVLQDMLGISDKAPKFSKNYLAQASSIQDALSAYRKEVLNGAFPEPKHGF